MTNAELRKQVEGELALVDEKGAELAAVLSRDLTPHEREMAEIFVSRRVAASIVAPTGAGHGLAGSVTNNIGAINVPGGAQRVQDPLVFAHSFERVMRGRGMRRR